MSKVNYKKLNKQDLLTAVLNMDATLGTCEATQRKYNLLKIARKEDAKLLQDSKVVINTFKQRQNDLINSVNKQRELMYKDLQEQNQTIATLFEMMDRSIEQEIFYYNKFKSIFIKPPVPKRQEAQIVPAQNEEILDEKETPES